MKRDVRTDHATATPSVDVATTRLERLPALAWILRKRGDRVDAGLGPQVRLGETSFFEGGYALTTGPDALRSDAVYFGSGATWRNGRLTLLSPTHTFESVWVVRTRHATWATNSLHLAIAAVQPTGFDIRSERRTLELYHASISAAPRKVFSGPDARIFRFGNAFVEIADDDPMERQLEQPPRFSTFDTYVAHLVDVGRQCLESSGTSECAVYLSKGYDSPACAVLGRAVAPTTAITVDRTSEGDDDDGSEIARDLGMPVQRIHRRERRVVPFRRGVEGPPAELLEPRDYESVSEFFNGYSIAEESLAPSADAAAGKLVLFGHTGDAMWKTTGKIWRDFSGEVPSRTGGTTTGEFRLRTGFTLFPPAAVAFNHAAAVRAISLSDEMAPWRIGGDYDRPIPRRIVEEAGVPREAFGQRKMYISTSPANLLRIAPTLFDMQVAKYAPAMEEWHATEPGMEGM